MNTANAPKLSQLENVRIMEHINGYFNELNRKNRDYEIIGKKNKTILTYESEIRQFFFMKGKEKGKELEYLSMDDINITQEDYEEYIEKLCAMKNENGDNKYVNKSINKKTSAIKSMLRYLKRKKVIDVDISYLELIKGEKEKRNHYGVLDHSEVMDMVNLCLHEKEKNEVKRMLILFAYKTGLRLSELLDLKWNSFILKQNEVFVRGVGKGNKEFEIKITKEVYEELLKLNQGQSEVFSISSKGVNRLMDRLKEKMNIQPERQIVFHSLRKAFGTLIYKATSDINQSRIALRHESVATTQIYLGISDCEVNDVIFSVDKIETDLYKNVSHEDLVKAIAECPKNIQLILNMKIFENAKTK